MMKRKLVWCPESASQAYIDTVTALSGRNLEGTPSAELVSALASGWKAQLIIEAWAPSKTTATSIGLVLASRHSSSTRHVCIVPNGHAENEYREAMRTACVDSTRVEVVVGDVEEVTGAMDGVEFMVVDGKSVNVEKIVKNVRAGPRGMVVVCVNQERRRSSLKMVGGIVRSVFLPVGDGVEIVHVGVPQTELRSESGGGGPRQLWIKHVDRDTGEVHMFPK